MKFKVIKEDKASGARLGELIHNRIKVETPVFMPVGTQGTVKAAYHLSFSRLDFPVLLCNSYHLYLRPGVELIRKAGGLHKFIGWDRLILTDSGGYQIYSMSDLRDISPKGVRFRSHLDGSEHFISPENAIAIQQGLGADIIMCFDECIPYPAGEKYAASSTSMTLEWAERCKRAHRGQRGQALFGIVQGGMYPHLRRECALALKKMNFPGYALGGLSVGEGAEKMRAMIETTTGELPVDKPRYLMGVGKPEDIWEAVARGIDMFDCVMPTRLGRSGTAYTSEGKLVVKNAACAEDFRPLDSKCSCYTCRGHSRAYIRHLFNAGEVSGMMLLTLHNLTFMDKMMARIRKAIAAGRFDAEKEKFLAPGY